MNEVVSLSSPTSEKTVLITGVAGYIGSHTALAFLDAGWHVIGIDNLSIGERSAVPSGVEFLEMDCHSPDLVGVLKGRGINAAVHFAGLIRVDESVARPVPYYTANVGHAGQFFQSATQLGIPAVVFSSTAAIYQGGGLRPKNEETALDPASPYGRSKLAAEWQLRDHSAATGLRHVILRYFNVAGADPQGRAGPRKDASHLIKAVAEAAVGRRTGVVIHGIDYPTEDGTCVRDFIHVTDLAEAHHAAVEHLLAGGENLTLNCGYGRGFSVRDVVLRALKLADVPFEVTVGARRPGDAVSVVADNQKLRSQLGWKPRYDNLDVILETAIEWERIRLRSVEAGLAQAKAIPIGAAGLGVAQ